MTRKEFLTHVGTLGLSAPFLSYLLSACDDDDLFFPEFDVNFSGKVLVIGAGAAGLLAGHVLNRYNIDFEILEASPQYGGRVKEISDFADFPIDLGAEWIHTDPNVLARLLNDRDTRAEIEFINYAPDTLNIWKNGKLQKRNFFTNFYGEYKFKNTTWFNFFDRYIAPPIWDRIRYEHPVVEIDYSGNQVAVTTLSGETFEADRIILTVPLTQLKNNSIRFLPNFPPEKQNALDQVEMPDGIKVFIEFSERFYPDLLFFEGLFGILDSSQGERIYYDAAFRKDSQRNILGLFTVGDPATPYAQITDDDELIQFMLAELDEIFEGRPSQLYLKHITQNWTQTPYIQGSYSHYQSDGAKEILTQPIENKIFFAGEAYAGDESTVHGAGESAYVAVERILRGIG
ncbi:MAG: NAD(P)/FAD-dependent oxidoreductase [Bacteroidota bacterium]